jgi:hypothetical protein
MRLSWATLWLGLACATTAMSLHPASGTLVPHFNLSLPAGSIGAVQARVDAHVARAVQRAETPRGLLGDPPSSSRFAILNRALLWCVPREGVGAGGWGPRWVGRGVTVRRQASRWFVV